MSHGCHAVNCQLEVPPRLLFCARHWAMTPKNLQALIWKHYVPGQEVRKDPTDAYLEAQEYVVRFVESLERGEPLVPVWTVLSLTQPWATLVAIGAKRWETRSRRSHYRGPVAIHSSKEFPEYAQDACIRNPFAKTIGRLRDKLGAPSFMDVLPCGQILAVASQVRCEPAESLVTYLPGTELLQSSTIGEDEAYFGNYTPGRFAYELERATQVRPVPASGALGFWKFAGELVGLDGKPLSPADFAAPVSDAPPVPKGKRRPSAAAQGELGL